MTERSTVGSERLEFQTVDWDIGLICPHCDREERFGDELTARAWITSHINEEHGDELPALYNTESDRT